MKDILFQSKYDCGSITNLTRNLFTYSLFEKVILSNFLKYFDTHTQATKAAEDNVVYEKVLIELLAEYFVEHKELLSTESGYLRQVLDSGESFFERTTQVKNLSHIVRCLEAKKNDGN